MKALIFLVLYMLFGVCQTLEVLGGSAVKHLGTLNNRLKNLEDEVSKLLYIVEEAETPTFTVIDGTPKDCQEIYNNGTRVNGVYTISPDGRCPIIVYCDMTGGGWTVIQRRSNGRVSFARPWTDYVQGFGELRGEHWLGLESIHRLTADGSEIYFDMEMWDDTRDYAHYKNFIVHDAVSAYRMNVDTAGYEGSIEESLSYNDNMKFSTYDRDNDLSDENCSKQRMNSGGWWINKCLYGNFNGSYVKHEDGGIWQWYYGLISVKSLTIKVRSMFGRCCK